MRKHRYAFIGRGVYSLGDAERLTGVPRRRIRRWTTGYQWTADGCLHSSEPVIGSELPTLFGAPALDFADLIEVRFLDAFLRRGVSWRAIRIAAHRAKEVLEASHPFSHRRFSTDGQTILAELAKDQTDRVLLDLVRDQYELDSMIARYLFGEIEFGGQLPRRWFPLGLHRQVVIDPERSMGAPIVRDAGVPTTTLAQAVEAEDSIELVADMFDVDPVAVADAVEFEASR